MGLLHLCIDSFSFPTLKGDGCPTESGSAGGVSPHWGGCDSTSDMRTRVARGCHFLISYGDTLLPGSMTRLPAPSRACPIARHPTGAGRHE